MKRDVVVLGSGPAGLATAIRCAAAGLKVTLLDRYTFPRSSVGEAVHPGAEVLFDRLGVAEPVRRAGFVRHSGIWMQGLGHRDFIAFGETAGRPWQGFQLWRSVFDQILLDQAERVGCEFVAPCVPSEVVASGRDVDITSNVGNFKAKIVVDATGRNRWLARRWGLKIHNFSPPLVARYEYAEGSSSDLDENPVFAASNNGWEWTARVRENFYQRISLRYTREKRGSKKRSSSSFDALRPAGRSRGADVTWTLVDRAAGRQHFLVGDAAAVLDPSSSHGVLRALSSGILTANCILKILGNDQESGNAAVAGYSAWLRNWFLRDVNRMATLRLKIQDPRSSAPSIPSFPRHRVPVFVRDVGP